MIYLIKYVDRFIRMKAASALLRANKKDLQAKLVLREIANPEELAKKINREIGEYEWSLQMNKKSFYPSIDVLSVNQNKYGIEY